MRNLFTFFTFLALVGAACDDTNKTPTAANCEPLTTLEACWNAGCDFDTAWRTILYDGHCAAVHEGKFCFVGGESSNNLTMTVCRETAEGTESMTLGSLWDRVEGWQACGEYVDQCGGVETEICEAQTDRAACESRHCFWAEPIQVGHMEGGVCTGWETETIAACLTPEPYLIYYDDTNNFATDPRQFEFVFTTTDGTEVYQLEVGAAASFASGPDFARVVWHRCPIDGSEPDCGCP
jgi:hypothetical protein